MIINAHYLDTYFINDHLMDKNAYLGSLISGGAAGTAVDFILFPLDTVKTRLQSPKGFWKSGGFHGVYSGLPSTVLGSAPTAAVFFTTYDSTKRSLNEGKHFNPMASQLIAANVGEVSACLIRVPVEVVKQRAQAQSNTTSFQVFKNTLQTEGIRGFYRGYLTTIMREIPFASIQMPLWEFFKEYIRIKSLNNTCEPWQSALCGAIAGGISAALTTPLDVAKTRIILSKKENLHTKWRIANTLKEVFAENGVKGLFAGVVPRVSMISFGGFIFFGVYEKVKKHVEKIL